MVHTRSVHVQAIWSQFPSLITQYSVHLVHFFVHILDSASSTQICWVELPFFYRGLVKLRLEHLWLPIFLPIVHFYLFLHLLILPFIPHDLVGCLDSYNDATYQWAIGCHGPPETSSHLFFFVYSLSINEFQIPDLFCFMHVFFLFSFELSSDPSFWFSLDAELVGVPQFLF